MDKLLNIESKKVNNKTKVKSNEKMIWVEKYRPRTLEDIHGHSDIIHVLNNFIDKGELPHLLFYGPPGTGKTSTILACAKKMYGLEHYKKMILELNASDERGINVVRNKIKQFVKTKSFFEDRYKLVILDEADAMTRDAQTALRRIIEQYANNARFCLICNYLNKIIEPLQSRCTYFRFGSLEEVNIRETLNKIIDNEKLKIDETTLNNVIKTGDGDLRKCVNYLQTIHNSSNNEDNENYGSMLKPVSELKLDMILDIIRNNDISEAYLKIQQYKDENSLLLTNIIKQVQIWGLNSGLEKDKQMYLLIQLAEMEYRLKMGADEDIQLSCIISMLKIVM